ncbi:MAG TPA: suppressor of fused domain protein [Bacteroidales bacterium]|nr:suppressor of fused domain protein [Bacteroidales bacterium]
MELTSQMKEIAQMLSEINGGRPKIDRYHDDNQQSEIDIVTMNNKPDKGEITYATIGLSNHDIGLTIENKPLRIEIAGACVSEFAEFGNIISTCAFNIINSGYECYPGAIFPDVVGMYHENLEMKHILFIPPFLWDDKLETLYFEDKVVTWLQAVPISEAEYEYAEENGAEALEDLLEEAEVDILDLNRRSVL